MDNHTNDIYEVSMLMVNANKNVSDGNVQQSPGG